MHYPKSIAEIPPSILTQETSYPEHISDTIPPSKRRRVQSQFRPLGKAASRKPQKERTPQQGDTAPADPPIQKEMQPISEQATRTQNSTAFSPKARHPLSPPPPPLSSPPSPAKQPPDTEPATRTPNKATQPATPDQDSGPSTPLEDEKNRAAYSDASESASPSPPNDPPSALRTRTRDFLARVRAVLLTEHPHLSSMQKIAINAIFAEGMARCMQDGSDPAGVRSEVLASVDLVAGFKGREEGSSVGEMEDESGLESGGSENEDEGGAGKIAKRKRVSEAEEHGDATKDARDAGRKRVKMSTPVDRGEVEENGLRRRSVRRTKGTRYKLLPGAIQKREARVLRDGYAESDSEDGHGPNFAEENNDMLDQEGANTRRNDGAEDIVVGQRRSVRSTKGTRYQLPPGAIQKREARELRDGYAESESESESESGDGKGNGIERARVKPKLREENEGMRGEVEAGEMKYRTGRGDKDCCLM